MGGDVYTFDPTPFRIFKSKFFVVHDWQNGMTSHTGCEDLALAEEVLADHVAQWPEHTHWIQPVL